MTYMSNAEPMALNDNFCEYLNKTGTLLPVDMAVKKCLRLAIPVTGSELLPHSQALSRVLDTALMAPSPQPLFDNSAMDGYAPMTQADGFAIIEPGKLSVRPGDKVPFFAIGANQVHLTKY